jgi:hypothetical protein
MKTRIVILIGICALLTLSFTFVVQTKNHESVTKNEPVNAEAPVGGLASEEIQ